MSVSPHKQPFGSNAQREGEPDYPPSYEVDDYDIFDTDHDDDDCSWWSEDDILNNSDYDGQQYIPIQHNINPQNVNQSESEQEGVVSVQYLPPNPSENNNNNKILTSNKSKPSVKSWVCEQCNAINNLHHSIEREFECIACTNRYRPGQLLIESKAEDEPLNNCKLYTVWICNSCSWSNHIDWNECSMCSQIKQKEDIQIFHITDKPQKYHHKPWDNKISTNPNNKKHDDEWYKNEDKKHDDIAIKKEDKNGVIEKSEEISEKKPNKSTEFRLFEETQQYKQDLFKYDKLVKEISNYKHNSLDWNSDFKFIE